MIKKIGVLLCIMFASAFSDPPREFEIHFGVPGAPIQMRIYYRYHDPNASYFMDLVFPKIEYHLINKGLVHCVFIPYPEFESPSQEYVLNVMPLIPNVFSDMTSGIQLPDILKKEFVKRFLSISERYTPEELVGMMEEYVSEIKNKGLLRTSELPSHMDNTVSEAQERFAMSHKRSFKTPIAAILHTKIFEEGKYPTFEEVWNLAKQLVPLGKLQEMEKEHMFFMHKIYRGESQ